jgi:hypothetical protein
VLKRISGAIKAHDWFTVGVEILVVVIGLLLAFRLDRWREARVDLQTERVVVERLIANIEDDVPAIEYAIELQSLRLELIDLLMAAVDDPEVVREAPVVFLGAVTQAAYTYTPTLTTHAFVNLRTTGDLGLIRDESVKEMLFDYYGWDESQRQYRPLQFATESRHFQLAAGVLTAEQHVFIQAGWLFFRPNNVASARAATTDVEEALAARERLRARPELIAWLPFVRDLQLEQIATHRTRLERAADSLEILRSYARGIGAGGE